MTYDEGIINLAILYAKEYEKRPKNLVNCFLKYQSVRSVCRQIVIVFKKLGAFQNEKDFSDWANKQPVEEKWKPVLAEIMSIIYSILKK